MHAPDFVDLLAYSSSIALAITVGRTNIRKQTIASLMQLVEAHEKTICNLKEEREGFLEEISYLREVVDGYSELVREGALAGSNRKSSGNRPVASKTSKNRSP